MNSETYHTFDRSNGQKRPIRPKLLKLADVSIPHRNRKKTKIKVKERSQSNVRDRIYDDPAYTDDISHLAIPHRQSSTVGDNNGSLHKRKSHKGGIFSKRVEIEGYEQDDSSSSDNMTGKVSSKRGRSLERSAMVERSPKKREKRDRLAKQKRNLSLDNNLTGNARRSLDRAEISTKMNVKSGNIDSENWNIFPTGISDSSKTTENDDFSGRSKEPKMHLGRKLLKGEIGIKSFNYYLIKEGLKSSKKFVEKQKNSFTGSSSSKKAISRSEENIYEEIFFKDKSEEENEESSIIYPDCELCMQQCTKEDCEYCYDDMKSRSLGRTDQRRSFNKSIPRNVTIIDGPLPDHLSENAHILEFQSYNPNNPGVYKIETTPVAFTSDYNPIDQFQQTDNQKYMQNPMHFKPQQQHTKLNFIQPATAFYQQPPPVPLPRRGTKVATGSVPGQRTNQKSSSSSDSLHHKYKSEQYDFMRQPLIYATPSGAILATTAPGGRYTLGGSQILTPYAEPNIYKSDSKASIISEYSVRSENSNPNIRRGRGGGGEVSDSSLGDSMFSYSTTQKRYFGSSESCRFAFECRRCSLDGEKCSFSDTCRYECRNCDCSSSYFSSDFDDLNYGRKSSAGQSTGSQKSYDYYNETMDVKQNKYAQDFFKHVSDVKKSIYQAELQRNSTSMGIHMDPYGTMPPHKQPQGVPGVHYRQSRGNSARPSGQAGSIVYTTLPIPKESKKANIELIYAKPNVSSKKARQSQLQKGEYSSLERLLKKPTGAIPKGSSTASSSSSHKSHSLRIAKDEIGLTKSPQQSPKLRKIVEKRKDLSPKAAPRDTTQYVNCEESPKQTLPIKSKMTTAVVSSAKNLNNEANVTAGDNSASCCYSSPNNSIRSSSSCRSADGSANGSARCTDNSPGKLARSTTANVEMGKARKFEKAAAADGDDDVFFSARSEDSNGMGNEFIRKKKPPQDDARTTQLKKSEQTDIHQKCPSAVAASSAAQLPLPLKKSEANSCEPTTTMTNLSQPDRNENSTTKMKTVKVSAGAEITEIDRAPELAQAPSPNPSPQTESTVATADEGEIEFQQQNNAADQCADSVNDKEMGIVTKTNDYKVIESGDLPSLVTETVDEAVSAVSGKTTLPSSTAITVVDIVTPSTAPTVVSSTTNVVSTGPPTSGAAAADGTGAVVYVTVVAAASGGKGKSNSADEFSLDSDIAGGTFNRNLKRPPLIRTDYSCLDTSDVTSTDESRVRRISIDSAGAKLDISNLPLPALPPKRRRSRARVKPENDSAVSAPRNQSKNLTVPNIGKRRESLEISSRTFQEKLEARKMHFHQVGHMGSQKPTYLFGENNRLSGGKKCASNNDEIFLNKSGWVQVNSNKRSNDENCLGASNSRKANYSVPRFENQSNGLKNTIRVIHIDNTGREKPVYAVPKVANSKIEELISRSEARRNTSTNRSYMKPGFKIVDPHIASLLNERPGFLPVRNFLDSESPPPVTPILSPPPAFQDSKASGDNIRVKITSSSNPHEPSKINKGMVFSRSFEYDTRRPKDIYAETFSRSFDCNLSDKPPPQRDRSPNFGNLTGCSPNYLTKKEPSQSRDSSPNYQTNLTITYPATSKVQPPTSTAAEKPIYSVPRKPEKSKTNFERNGRSRKAQFSRVNPKAISGVSRFRSFDASVSQRLNSCDSGARSDLSNDELDNDEESSEFLTTNYHSPTTYRQQRQRSLTPDRNDSHSSSNSLRKQRSLTPESRSLTPEDRRKRGSQISLNSRQNSSSRSNTLERKDNKSLSASRSSSSSSYSGRDDIAPVVTTRRAATRSSKSAEEHRIRRSKSLQLTEKSPNRNAQTTHKKSAINQPGGYHHQPQQAIPVRNSNFPPTIRPNQIISDPPAATAAPANRNLRSTDIDKSRSFDFDYGTYNNSNVSMLEFDKSRSFDEDYREKSNNNSKYLKADANLVVKSRRSSPAMGARKTTSPQNYGMRLCDHELTYDMIRRKLDRSPIMDFSRDYDVPKSMKNSETINAGGNSELNFLNNERIYDHPTTIPLKSDKSYSIDRLNNSHGSLTPDSGSEFKTSLSCELRSEYAYRKQQKPPRATAIQGSTRGSYRPPGQNSKYYNKVDDDEDDDSLYATCDGASDNRLKLSRDDNRAVYVNVPNRRQARGVYVNAGVDRKHRAGRGSSEVVSKTSIYVNASPMRLKSSTSMVFLGEHEMPITRERLDSPVSSQSRASKESRRSGGRQKIRIPKRQHGHEQDKPYHTEGHQQRPRVYLMRQRSISLPNVQLLQSQFPSPTKPMDNKTNNSTSSAKRSPFSSNLQNQMRAVSSPSLADHPIDTLPSECTEPAVAVNQYRATSGGVLQKFKRTFPIFKQTVPAGQSPNVSVSLSNGGSSISAGSKHTSITSTSTNSSVDTCSKSRFGGLIWRSSKERRQTKYNRRDKCNSGDSGIQIELENDEHYGLDSIHNILTKANGSTSAAGVNIHVRRANSAKVTGSTPASSLSAKAKALKKVDSCYDNKLSNPTLPTRSLSQPTGLDRISKADHDESDTDSVSSHPDLHVDGRNQALYAEVLFTFTPAGPQELALERGALVEILRRETGPWWFGRIKHDAVVEKILEPQRGWFPKDFVRVVGDFAEDDDEKTEEDSTLVETTLVESDAPADETIVSAIEADSDEHSACPKVSLTQSIMSRDSVTSAESLRNSVIKELLETEITYVKLLSSLCLGFIPEMRKRIDIFSTESLNLIFSNIESIWRFQQSFLDALRIGVETDRIAQVFLEHQSSFLVYSAYCNSYPRALIELDTYSRSKEAKMVLENCRQTENLPELPLSAHLLAPIQRICRYPLQLAELMKHTTTTSSQYCAPSEAADFDEMDCSLVCGPDSKDMLEMALNAMKKVTESVNEGKRHSEHLARFQSSFENFQGPPLHFHSTRFFMQTDATRVSPNLWNNTFTLFLFDHQLIYCKKDILKRNHFIYKGRIFLDNCRILNLPDGKICGVTVKNALRIYCESLRKWFDFSFRSASRKLRFLSTLAVERQFCGKSLFISELAGEEEDNLSDREYHSDYDTPTENTYNSLIYDQSDKIPESPAKLQKYSADTLPKKSRQLSTNSKDRYDYQSGSLGRRKISSWFRKSKSTNSTPNQSPTHNPSVIVFNSVSDSSSQSSPALSKTKTKDSQGSSS